MRKNRASILMLLVLEDFRYHFGMGGEGLNQYHWTVIVRARMSDDVSVTNCFDNIFMDLVLELSFP